MSVLNRKYSDRMDALNKEVNDQSPGDIKTPSRIKRPISMYEKNLSTKSNTVSGQSPPKSETSTMRHALKRYQSHLTELKEIKPNPPPIDLPPVQVFERPKTPVVTPPEPESLSGESIETVENFPEPEPFPINHVPGYLSDPASTLLMTAALNALTQAQAQVKVQPPNGKSTSRDPMAAALAAASAQIIAATLIRPAPPPPVEIPPLPPTPPRAPTPPPPPPVITMNSVSTETDIEERPSSPVMAKELHDRMRRSGMTQVYPPQGYPGGMSGSYSNSSSSYDRGGYGGFSSSHSGGYPQSPYGHSYHQPQYPPHPQHQHQQYHSDRYQQGLRPALPTSNSFELPPSRSLSSSSASGLRNNQLISKSAKQSPVPVPLKKPQPVPLPPQPPQPSQHLQTTVRAPSPPLPLSPPVASLSLPISAGRSTSLEGAGIASVSAGSPLPSARDAELKKDILTPPLSSIKTEVAPSAPVSAVSEVTAPAVVASSAPESSHVGINNISSNSFAHWPDLPAIDTTITTTTTPKRLLPLPSGPDRVLHRTNGSDYSILKSNMSVSSATSARNSRNLTFSDTVNTPNKTQEEEKEDNFPPGLLMSPSYKDFHVKYTNGMQAVQSVKSDSFSPRADLLGAENEHVLATHSLSTTSADISELDDSSRTNLVPSENSSPKHKTLSRKDKTNTPKNNNHHEKTNENIPETSPASTSPTRTMMDTLLLQTNFLHHRQEIQAQYKAPEHVYMKQFNSVDPRVFEVEFENNQSAALTPVPRTPTRAQYRNSIMELIVATPNFVQSPRHNSDTIDADLEKAAFNASFMNSTRLQNRQLEKEEENNSDTGSEYDGSVIESQEDEEEEETKSDTMSDLDAQSVHTLQTTESSVLGVHPAQVNDCMIHKLLGTHSEHNMPVEFGSRKSAKVSTNNDISAKDNAASASNFSNAISNLNMGNEETVQLNTSEKDYDYVSVDDDTINSAPVIETPVRAEKSLHSRKASSTNTPNVNNTSVMSLPNPSMLQHTSSTRSVHRSFKYDEGMKKHILGRQTTSIKGQNKLHETALEFKQDACLNSIDAKNLKLASVTNRNVLVGWQILILKKGELSLLGLAVVTGVRTNLLMQTEYRISSDVSLDCWVRLKRGKGMGGTEFQPLRKVLTTKQCSTKMRVIEYKKTI